VIEPEALQEVRQKVRNQIRGLWEEQDRRGFQLLQWAPVRANDAGKPVELSLEHEARLEPVDEHAALNFRKALSKNDGRPANEFLLQGLEKDDEGFGNLVVMSYDRPTGPQSVDRYYEIAPGAAGAALIPQMITIRERIQTSKFMTWSTTDSMMRPLNLELPFVAYGHSGMTVRLEFNWIDNLQESLREVDSRESDEAIRWTNPLYIAAQLHNLVLSDLHPVFEHTTYRQKFGLWEKGSGAANERELFAINIDTVVAQDLASKGSGTYQDIDISSVERIDTAVLQRLILLTEILSARYHLRPNNGTKAWRDSLVLGRNIDLTQPI
jgi:hypothetical protein